MGPRVQGRACGGCRRAAFEDAWAHNRQFELALSAQYKSQIHLTNFKGTSENPFAAKGPNGAHSSPSHMQSAVVRISHLEGTSHGMGGRPFVLTNMLMGTSVKVPSSFSKGIVRLEYPCPTPMLIMILPWSWLVNCGRSTSLSFAKSFRCHIVTLLMMSIIVGNFDLKNAVDKALRLA